MVFRGYPILYGGPAGRGGLSVGLVLAPSISSHYCSRCRAALGGLPCCPLAVRRTVVISVERIHRADRRSQRLPAREHSLAVAGTLVGSAGTLLTRLMATPWAGRYQYSLRCTQGRIDSRRHTAVIAGEGDRTR